MQHSFQATAVIGAGQMGNGIAQILATLGIRVDLIDISTAQLDKAKKNITQSLEKLVSKNVITAAVQTQALERLNFSTDMNKINQQDLVIEAATENETIKREILQNIDQKLRAGAIIATNTSSISITKLASYTKRPELFIGMHFMNPVPLMKLVEIIPGLATAKTTTERITELAAALGKETSTSQDYPGFVVNRILMPMINEAFYTLMEGVASPADIDKGMKLGTNQPMGPLTLADFIGLDTCLAIMQVLYNGLGDSKYRPCPLLVKHVEAGWLGKKTGRGIYTYS